MATRGGVGTLLLLVTSCVAPTLRYTAAPPPRVADAHRLVRLLAPGLSENAVAGLPAETTAAPVAAPLAAAPFLEPAASLGDADRARQCLTEAVYYEARSEPEDGQRAVAQVVLNRVRDRAFPHSVCGVVYQGVGTGRSCQFSFACDGSMLRLREPNAWARAERIAMAALAGDVMPAVGNATFYHANYVLPWWASSLTRLGAVGSHIFYRWPGAIERALGMGARYAGIEAGTPVAQPGLAAGSAMVASFGVTVHRGSDGGAAEPAATTPAALLTAPAAMPRYSVTGGVRIHRGEDAPATADTET